MLRRFFVAPAVALSILSACAKPAPPRLKPKPPVAVKVLVPIAKPCEVQKVFPSPMVSEIYLQSSDIYEMVKAILSDRATLLADREQLLAANDKPCG